MGTILRRADGFHLGLILASLALAYLLPFELLLLSYAVLGPAHYFTEINWLHDRRYFLPHPALALILVAACAGALLVGDLYWAGVILWSGFFTAAILANVSAPLRAASIIGLAAAGTAALLLQGMPFIAVAILLPTFVHVCVFTLLFMTLGALRAGSPVQFALIGVYLAGIALILVVPPSEHTVVPQLATLGQIYFGSIARTFGQLAGVPDLQFGGRVTGLLSFVYTYHYLNWFIKADVIRWTQISRPRLIAIVALSAASTALYFYDYAIGLVVLLAISQAHVVLEFPLNALSMRQLGAALMRRSATTRSAA